MSKISLELDINTTLYHGLCESSMSLIGHTAYRLLFVKLGVRAFMNKYYIKYKMLSDDYNNLILKMTVGETIDYITINNDLSSFIINTDKVRNEILIDSLCKDYKDRDIWKKFINKIYSKTKNNKSCDKNKWNLVNIRKIDIISDTFPVSVYSKQNEYGEILIGFNLEVSGYNYFTKEYSLQKENKATNLKGKTIEELDISIGNKTYNIRTKDKINDTLKLYVNLYNNVEEFGLEDISNIKIEDFAILTRHNNGLCLITFKDSNKDKLVFKDNLGNKYKVSDLINKIKVMGIKSLDLYNIRIYTYIPDKYFIPIKDNKHETYNYVIEYLQ